MKQSKIFRKIDNGIYYFKIVEYSPNQVYSELVLQEKQKGFRQVIINSEIMIKILSKVLTKEDFVVRVKSIILCKILYNVLPVSH